MNLSTLAYSPFLKLQGISFHKNLHLYGIPIIVKNKAAKIILGNNCHIRSSFLSNLVGLSQRTIICARDSSKIVIGNGVGISGATIYARSKIEIGDKSIIGGNVKILDNDFHPVDPELRLQSPCNGYGIAPIKIGSNVFIGCNSIILKGVTIGNNAVIGAGSVVTIDVPAGHLAVGNPAKVIKNLSNSKD